MQFKFQWHYIFWQGGEVLRLFWLKILLLLTHFFTLFLYIYTYTHVTQICSNAHHNNMGKNWPSKKQDWTVNPFSRQVLLSEKIQMVMTRYGCGGNGDEDSSCTQQTPAESWWTYHYSNINARLSACHLNWLNAKVTGPLQIHETTSMLLCGRQIYSHIHSS